ncbi:hypothetical protein [Helicobacter pylori]|nr:hypothetical protein [Helicobacter pylori]
MSGVHIVENMNTENTSISRTTASTPPPPTPSFNTTSPPQPTPRG